MVCPMGEEVNVTPNFQREVLSLLRSIGELVRSIQPINISVTSYQPCPRCKEFKVGEEMGVLMPVIDGGQLWWACSRWPSYKVP